MEKKNREDLISIEYSLNIDTALKTQMQGATIQRLSKKIGVNNVVGYISFLLIRAQDFLNVKSKMNNEQVLILSYDVLESFKGDTIEDIVLMLKMARKGFFDKTYHKIDSETLFNNWIPGYREFKYSNLEQMKKKEKPETNRVNSIGLDIWKELKKTVEENKTEEQEERIFTRSFHEDQKRKFEESKPKK